MSKVTIHFSNKELDFEWHINNKDQVVVVIGGHAKRYTYQQLHKLILELSYAAREMFKERHPDVADQLTPEKDLAEFTLTPLYMYRVGEIADGLEYLINTTPSGDLRNKLTEVNIMFMDAERIMDPK